MSLSYLRKYESRILFKKQKNKILENSLSLIGTNTSSILISKIFLFSPKFQDNLNLITYFDFHIILFLHFCSSLLNLIDIVIKC